VIATVSGDDVEFVRSLGADKAIDYKAERFEDECRDMDLVLDLVGGQTQQRSWSVIKRGGRLVSTLGEPSKEEAAKHEASGARFTCEPNGEQLMRIAKLIDAQQVRVHVAERYAFEALTEALERLVQGHVRGKIVVRVR
jgi:NADPH:quinone reductase-like Zn-dependent oxidoreductase